MLLVHPVLVLSVGLSNKHHSKNEIRQRMSRIFLIYRYCIRIYYKIVIVYRIYWKRGSGIARIAVIFHGFKFGDCIGLCREHVFS